MNSIVTLLRASPALSRSAAVGVTEGGRNDLHVFDGQAEVRPNEGSPGNQLVNSGDGLTVNTKSEWKAIKSQSDRARRL